MAAYSDAGSQPSTGDLEASLEERNRDFRSTAVEAALEPFIAQVTTLSEYRARERKPGGKIRKASKLVQIVDKATRTFISVGEDLASENLEFQEDLLLACDDVRAAGEEMHRAGSEFARDTFRADKRAAMAAAGRQLLLAATRLMTVADAVDVSRLLNASKRIEEKVCGIQEARDEDDLMQKIRDLAPDIAHVTQLATLRQTEFKCEASQQLLVAAQTELNQSSRMLIATSKAFLQHRDLVEIAENSDYVITRMLESLKTLCLLADGEESFSTSYSDVEVGNTATAFAYFETLLEQSTMATSEVTKYEAQLQDSVESILTGASLFTDSSLTRDYRQHTIITLCGELKQQMSELALAFTSSGENGEEEKDGEKDYGRGESARRKVKESVLSAERVTGLRAKATELHQELHSATADHVSDCFAKVLAPLNSICAAASSGDQNLVEEREVTFGECAEQLRKVSALAISLSLDAEGIRMVHTAGKYVKTLRPQVINAATALAIRPNSHVAKKNMAVFKESWEENVALLNDCIGAIISLTDVMAVTEEHIVEDRARFLAAVDACNVVLLRDSVESMRGKCAGMLRIVQTDMGDNPEHYDPEMIHQVNFSTRKLNDKSLPWFYDIAWKAAHTLDSTRDVRTVNKYVLEEASLQLLEDVRNLRRNVLVAKSSSEELEKQPAVEDLPQSPSASFLSQASCSSLTGMSTLERKFARTPNHSAVFQQEDTTKTVMAELPADQQAKLAMAANELKEEKAKLDREAGKWETGDKQNDIVVVAKEMCMMMMDMSDFTRGVGNLRTPMDLIITAKDIARAGESLDQLARAIAEQCPDTECRKDLLAYLERVQLCCHQLKITSTVNSDQTTRVMVDSASALISAAKNLMNVVVQIVKTSYIASTAIARLEGTIPEQVFQWKLAAPKKKNLVSPSGPAADSHRRGRLVSPILQLGEFRPGRDIQAALEGKHKQQLPTGERTATSL